MNDCSNAEIRDLLPDLLHERLDVSARAAVEAHVATCVDCQDELQLLRDVLGMLDSQTPAMNVARITAALPKPPGRTVAPVDAIARGEAMRGEAMRGEAVQGVTPLSSRRRVWADWRVAAAVTLLVAGGSSAVLLKRDSTSPSTPSAVAVVPASGAAGSNGTSGAASATPAATGASNTPSAIAAAGSTSTAPSTSAASSAANSQESVAAAEDHAGADLGNGSRLGDLSEAQLQKLLMEIDKLPAVPVTDPEPVSLHVNASMSSEGT